ncbi:glycoside hydrolase family 16 protein [Lepidopterella palustris CBS 459.81]|uniref:Glycoside hydrolase family 16 protein n=1 Tax=Lepidopterella palustris CBS 459.81 TaxID=1314670 RepID=A0A8E2E4T8_9PEZI|nr:glycoside hydrolase family 16 protein [Lepidopterella palustris CBS 459.81]
MLIHSAFPCGYLDQNTAASQGLVSIRRSSVFIGVDHIHAALSGRSSIRITSENLYTPGLFISNLAHMPGSICDTKPPDVHTNARTSIALYTSDRCSINRNDESETVQTSNCYVQAAGQSNNVGCSIAVSTPWNVPPSSPNLLQRSIKAPSAIEFRYLIYSSAPGDINSNFPNPGGWSTALANSAGNCDIDTHFTNHMILFDLAFCRDWAGGVWEGTPSCSGLACKCTDYVANNPSSFQESCWLINSLRVHPWKKKLRYAR